MDDVDDTFLKSFTPFYQTVRRHVPQGDNFAKLNCLWTEIWYEKQRVTATSED